MGFGVSKSVSLNRCLANVKLVAVDFYDNPIEYINIIPKYHCDLPPLSLPMRQRHAVTAQPKMSVFTRTIMGETPHREPQENGRNRRGI